MAPCEVRGCPARYTAHPGRLRLGRDGTWSDVLKCIVGDALWVSRKRDDPLKAHRHIHVPSAEVLRDASTGGYGRRGGYICAHIQGVSPSMERPHTP